MTARVLDTSVILAIVFGEPGREEAARLAMGALMSSVNVTEIINKCLERGTEPEVATDYVKHSNITVLPFTLADSLLAGHISPHVRKGVLSLGDRACIATAIHAGVPVVTADRIWAELDLPCPVHLIR